MAYDEDLADRLRALLSDEEGLTEQRMFGGLAFLVHGNLAVSASSRGGLLLRVDPADAAALTQHPEVGPFEMRGRDLNGWLHVGTGALEDQEDLERWVQVGLAYARSLPEKVAQ